MKQYLPFIFLLAVLACNSPSPAPVMSGTQESTPIEQLNLPEITAVTADGMLQFADGTSRAIPHYGDPDYLIIYLARHCEKATDPADNPPLSAQGQAQAERLGRVMDNAVLDKISSTNTRRTVQTAEAVKRWAGDPPIETFPAMAQSDWFAETMTGGGGKRVFHVGHSNTIPVLLNEFIGAKNWQNIPENEYRHFFIAITKGLGQTEVLHFRY